MFKQIGVILSLTLGLLLSGCARTELDTPCPNYGKTCAQTPINSWNY